MKDQYEYIATYVDDLLIASEEPQKIIQDLKEKFKLKIKCNDTILPVISLFLLRSNNSMTRTLQ